MSSIFYHAARLPWPTDWAELYGRSAPLLLDIGFGGGHSLVDWAKARPDASVLGVEIALPSLRRGVQKIEKAALKNVCVVQGDARLILQACCAPGGVSEIHINFPDPWRKEKHYHRRLISDAFLHLAATRLVPGGLLDIATDHAEYAQWITERLERTPYFVNRRASTFVTDDSERLQTKYEALALAEGRICHYYKWARKERLPETAVPNPFPIPQETPMPHIIMKSPLTLADIGRQFRQMHAAPGDTHIKFLEAYQSFYDQKLLVETYIKEEPLSQRVGLAVQRRPTGELIVSLHDVGFSRPTRGIQQAIVHLARWIASLDQESAIITSNIAEELLSDIES